MREFCGSDVAAGRDLDGEAQRGVHCLAWQVPPNSKNYKLNQKSQENWNQQHSNTLGTVPGEMWNALKVIL